MFKLAELFVQIGARTSQFDAALAGIKAQLTSLAGMRMGLPFGGLASSLGLAGLGLSVGQAIRTAVALEDRIALLGKAADLSGSELAAMKAQIISLSTTLKGVRLDDLIDIATSGAKMGVATSELIRYTEGVAKVSAAIDDLPAGVIADQIGKLNTVFKLGVSGTMQFGSAIDKLADSGVSSASGILDVLARISGTAVASKVSAQEATALAAALLDTGSSAELGATSLSRLIMALNDVDAHKGFAKAMGVSTLDFARQVRSKPIAAIQDFLRAIREMNAGGQMKALAAIGVEGVQAQGELMKLAQQTDTLTRYIGLANNEFKTLDQITKSYGASANLTSSQLAVMQNRVQVIASDIGTAMLPSVNSAVAAFGDLTTAVTSTSETGQSTFGSFLSWVQEALDSAGAAFRNWGDVIDYTGVWVYGKIANLGNGFLWFKDLVAEAMRALGVSSFNHFNTVWEVGRNTVNNLKVLFTELWAYVKSGGADAFDWSKTVNVLKETSKPQDADFQMPKAKWTDVSDQLQEIQDRMANREIARTEKDAKAKADAADRIKQTGEAGAPAAGGTRTFETTKVGITDLDSYARELAEGALKAGSGEIAERTARGVEESVVAIREVRDAVRGGKSVAVYV